MRYYKTEKQFKSKRCTFNPHDMQAWSYDWWKFVECREGKVYLNMAPYSMQTGVQQYMVKTLLEELGVKYKRISVKAGLQNIDAEIARLVDENKSITEAINNPKTRMDVNIRRTEWIKDNLKTIQMLKAYSKKKVTSFKGKLNFEGITPPKKLTPQQLQRRRENKRRREQARVAGPTSINYTAHPSWLRTR